MTCPRPLDPIDAEALASGAEPVLAADAARHAAGCESCGARIEAARSLLDALDGLSGPPEAVSGLADRVMRLRAFSRRERRTYALWNTPVLLTAATAVSGTALLAFPGRPRPFPAWRIGSRDFAPFRPGSAGLTPPGTPRSC